MGTMLIRALFVASCAAIGFLLPPVGRSPIAGLLIGLLFAAAVVAAEVKLRSIPSNVLVGGVFGAFVGLVLALGLGIVTRQAELPMPAGGIVQGLALLVFVYLGIIIGANKGEWMTIATVKSMISERAGEQGRKVVDTSVLIDGRIADLCETGFVEGVLTVPHFVLGEMQQIADSGDELRRARGRRGLDVLHRLQQSSEIDVELSEADYPNLHEVDLKIIELATELGAKIVTNDYNLAKVATVRGVGVLNINELANAVKPLVLPGEAMSVRIVKEGKEPGQGVGYLDDGTMVVVDSAAADRGTTVDLEVTSVLQTSAGKMIFGKKPVRTQAFTETATARAGT